MKNRLFLVYLILVFVFCSCSKYFKQNYLSEKRVEVTTEIQRLFLNQSTEYILKNNLSKDIQNKLLSEKTLNDEIYRHLLIYDIIDIFKKRFNKFNVIKNNGDFIFRLNNFEYYFFYDYNISQPVISNIIYNGDDKIYNYIFNDDESNLQEEDIKIIMLNYFLTENNYFENILNKHREIYDLILFNNAESLLEKLIYEKNFNRFLHNYFVVSQYYINSFQFEYFFQFLKKNYDDFIYKDYIDVFLNKIHLIANYYAKDNFDKLRLYYLYKYNYFDLFNIYYFDFFKNYSNSLNSDILVLLKYDLIKYNTYNTDIKLLEQLVHYFSEYIDKDYYYFEFLYSIININKTEKELFKAQKTILEIKPKISNEEFVNFFEAYILHNNRQWTEAILEYRKIYSNLIMFRQQNAIKNLIEVIIRNQILNDDYVSLPTLGFDIIKTLKGMVIKEVFDNNKVITGDILLSIDEQPVNTYIDFLTIINTYKPGLECSVKILRDNRIKTFKYKIIDYVKK